MIQEPPFSWTCPHCGRTCIVTKDNYVVELTSFEETQGNHEGIALFPEWIICPNPKCKKYTLSAYLVKVTDTHGKLVTLKEWQLIPGSKAKIFPDYIPLAIRNDYTEACAILEGSPKASATLARRCLQGMIRDFWNVKGKSNLYEEINAIENKVEPEIWEAIDSTRQIGNIGAHMEKEIDKIIDVEPDEAKNLIELIELLIDEWYIHRYQRAEKVKKVKEIGAKKALEKKS